MTGPDYIVDIDGIRASPGGPDPQHRPGEAERGRPWLSILWRCCSTYSRVYRDPDATAYQGRCPRCGRQVNIKVGPGGSSNRFFEAY